MHLDRSWIFGNKLSNSLLISRSLASKKRFFLVFHEQSLAWTFAHCLVFFHLNKIRRQISNRTADIL